MNIKPSSRSELTGANLSHHRGICLLLCIVLFGASAPRDASAQCILTNPSFEFEDSGSNSFAGWFQFGAVGTSSSATHGYYSAVVSGADLGGWDVSAYWQRFDTAPGEQWTASVDAWHTSTNPVTGGSRGILNIEWRDSGHNLISYESHEIILPSTVRGEVQKVSVTSGPAPSGTAGTHFLLAVLQSPTDPPPDVYYDQATFYNVGPPSQYDKQWNDFPGGRTIEFSGRTWRVKGPGYYGPGPNLFNDSSESVWVDGGGRLHVTVKNIGGDWYSSEVVPEEALGYGDYIFTTVGRLDQLHHNVVLGLFIWEYGSCWSDAYWWWGAYNEIDIEYSKWGDPGNSVGQFVAQPWDWTGNLERFDCTFSDDELVSHAFRWLSDRVEFRAWRGGPHDESPLNMIHEWTYYGPHIPRPEQPRVHINLWKLGDPLPSDQEVVIDRFAFYPEGVTTGAQPPATPAYSLSSAFPNPFNPNTTIRYSLEKGGYTELTVFDVAGRRVRVLVSGFVPTGAHEIAWNGLDDSGRPVSSGVYFYRLRSGDFAETRKMVLLR
jgi:hypothetical protein